MRKWSPNSSQFRMQCVESPTTQEHDEKCAWSKFQKSDASYDDFCLFDLTYHYCDHTNPKVLLQRSHYGARPLGVTWALNLKRRLCRSESQQDTCKTVDHRPRRFWVQPTVKEFHRLETKRRLQNMVYVWVKGNLMRRTTCRFWMDWTLWNNGNLQCINRNDHCNRWRNSGASKNEQSKCHCFRGWCSFKVIFPN